MNQWKHTFDFEVIVGSARSRLSVQDDDFGGIVIEAEQEKGLFFAQLEVVECFDTIRVYFYSGRHIVTWFAS